MPDTTLDGSGEQTPGRRVLEGTDLEIAYTLLDDDLVLRVSKAGVQVFGVVLEKAAAPMTARQLLERKAESTDLVVTVGCGDVTKVAPKIVAEIQRLAEVAQ